MEVMTSQGYLVSVLEGKLFRKIIVDENAVETVQVLDDHVRDVESVDLLVGAAHVEHAIGQSG